MNRLPLAAAALCAVGFITFVSAQTTSVTSSSITVAGHPATGTVTFTPVAGAGGAVAAGQAIAVQVGGTLYSAQGFTSPIKAGVIPAGFTVPDACLAIAAVPNTAAQYLISINDVASKSTLTIQGAQGVCGTSFALDHYAPVQTALVGLTGVVTGTTPLASCKAPSSFYTSTNSSQAYGCVGSTYLPLTGTGTGSGTISVQIGTVTGLPAGSNPNRRNRWDTKRTSVELRYSGWCRRCRGCNRQRRSCRCYRCNWRCWPGGATGATGAASTATGPTGATGPQGVTGAAGSGSSSAGTCPHATANQFCVTAAPYNASGAGATTTTLNAALPSGSTSMTVASSSTFAAGQNVFITGGGTDDVTGTGHIATITAVSGNTITFAPATTSAAANNASVQHDDTAAFNAAVTAAVAAPNSGATIYVPNGLYLIRGPLLDTSASSAQIPMPKSQAYAGANVSIEIAGLSPVVQIGSSNGSILQTFATSGNLIGEQNSAGQYAPMTNVYLRLTKLQLRNYPNPTVNMVNGTYLTGLIVDDVIVDSGTAGAVRPSSATQIGIAMPTLTNSAFSRAPYAITSGQGTGMVLSEHTVADAIYADTDYIGFLSLNSSGSTQANGASVGYAWGQYCAYTLSDPPAGSSPSAITIRELDSEAPTIGTIYDGNNLLYGSINVWVPFNTNVVTQANPGIIGGAHVTVKNLSNREGVSSYVAASNPFTQFTAPNTTESVKLNASQAWLPGGTFVDDKYNDGSALPQNRAGLGVGNTDRTGVNAPAFCVDLTGNIVYISRTPFMIWNFDTVLSNTAAGVISFDGATPEDGEGSPVAKIFKSSSAYTGTCAAGTALTVVGEVITNCK